MVDKLWQEVLVEVQKIVSAAIFKTWFETSHMSEASTDRITISTIGPFQKSMLEKRYNPPLLEALDKIGYGGIPVSIVIGSKKVKPVTAPTQSNQSEPRLEHSPAEDLPSITPKHYTARVEGISHNYRQGLNERYTFENFIVGSANEFAYAACQAVAANPGTRYNPLFIYGGVGIGKTHLIQAVGNDILSRNKNAKIVYVSTEQFIQEFLDAIRIKKNKEFASNYRTADVLIIDDIQFISGKEKTQEEFFHTFNALHQANKQIILSSDKPPKEIATLEDRLRSRFVMGMIVDMQAPDYETRCAIIQAKAMALGHPLPPDVVGVIAEHTENNVRELEGFLNQILAYHELQNIPPTVDSVTASLGTHTSRLHKRVTPKAIAEKTARHFGVDMSEMIGPRRSKNITLPRHIAMYLMRSELNLSFPVIAMELGRKDHTTAMHCVYKIDREAKLDSELRDNIKRIKDALYA